MARLVDAGHVVIEGVAALNPANAFDTGNVRLDFTAAATQPQKDAAASALAAFDWSDGAQTAWANLKARADAVAFLADTLAGNKLLRAAADAARKGDNVTRAWTVSMKAAVAAATSLANLQTRVAALATLDPLSLDDVKAAIVASLNSGDVD